MSIFPKKLEKEYSEVPKEFFKKGSLVNLVFNEFNKIGYNVDCFVVNSVNYGAPQIRERVLFIGNRFGYEVDFPKPMFSNRKSDNLPPFKTLGCVIDKSKGFVDRDTDLMNFSKRKLEYLKQIPEGGNWRSLPIEIQKESMGKSWYLKGGRSAYWRKLSMHFPSPTIVTMPNHAGTSMCHPYELRAITVGEAAAIQEFPEEWQFVGNATSKFRQIGNAVPLILGYTAGKVIMNLIHKINSKGMAEKPLISSRIVHIRPHVRTRTFWKDGKTFAGNVDYYNDTEKKQLNLFNY